MKDFEFSLSIDLFDWEKLDLNVKDCLKLNSNDRDKCGSGQIRFFYDRFSEIWFIRAVLACHRERISYTASSTGGK